MTDLTGNDVDLKALATYILGAGRTELLDYEMVRLLAKELGIEMNIYLFEDLWEVVYHARVELSWDD